MYDFRYSTDRCRFTSTFTPTASSSRIRPLMRPLITPELVAGKVTLRPLDLGTDYPQPVLVLALGAAVEPPTHQLVVVEVSPVAVDRRIHEVQPLGVVADHHDVVAVLTLRVLPRVTPSLEVDDHGVTNVYRVDQVLDREVFPSFSSDTVLGQCSNDSLGTGTIPRSLSQLSSIILAKRYWVAYTDY